MSNHLETIEARLLERPTPFHGSVFQNSTLLHFRKHCRTSFVVYLDVIEKRSAFSHIDGEVSFLTYLVVPILMIRSNRNHNVVASDLCAQVQRTQRTYQKTYNY